MKKVKHPRITRSASANKTYPGYCHSSSHKGYMVLNAICDHQCLEKDCPRFEKLEHPVWSEKDYTTQIISRKKLNRIKEKYADYAKGKED